MKRIVAVLLALFLLMGAALADESTLLVSGSGTVYLDADCVSVTMGVELSGGDLTSLQQQVNATINTICDALIAAGLEEKNIATNQFYVSPRYNYESAYSVSSASVATSSADQNYISGYTVSNTLSIQTDEIDRIGAYIDAAFAAGANSFNSINFAAKDDSAARKLALERSVADARQKAEIIAAASGKALGDVISICEGGVSSYAKSNSYDGWYEYAMEGSSASGATVRASQVVVSANVQITYELK